MVQLSELHGAIDKAGKVIRACRHCDAQSGWRVLELAGSGVRSANDVLSPPLKQGRVWVKFGEPEPKIIKFSQEELAVARFSNACSHVQIPSRWWRNRAQYQ